MTGIYGIMNSITGEWYVGQSVDIAARNKREQYNLNHGFMHWGACDNKHLVNAWEKYGPAAFVWVVLEECFVDDLDEKERFWIMQKDSYANGYNRTLGGGGVRGYKANQETRQKIRDHHADIRGENNPMYGKMKSGKDAIHYGKKHTECARKKMRENHADVSGERNPRARAVLQFSTSGSLLARWACLTEAAKALSINHRNISMVCGGQRKTAGGYVWRYET